MVSRHSHEQHGYIYTRAAHDPGFLVARFAAGLWTGSRNKTGNEWNWQEQNQKQIKFYSSEKNLKFEMAINQLIMNLDFIYANMMLTHPMREMPALSCKLIIG